MIISIMDRYTTIDGAYTMLLKPVLRSAHTKEKYKGRENQEVVAVGVIVQIPFTPFTLRIEIRFVNTLS